MRTLRAHWSSVLVLGALVAGVAVTAPWEEHVAAVEIADPVDLQILAVRPNDPSFALVDLASGTVTTYARPAHRMGGDAIDGAVITARGHTLVWSQGVARLFTTGLDVLDTVVHPDPLRGVPGVAPSLRVVPAPDGASAWLVQAGQDCCGLRHPTLVELVDLPSGRRAAAFELEPGTFPVAATGTGLVVGRERLVDTGDGWVAEPGSGRVLHLDADGGLDEVGPGHALAASQAEVVRLACPPAEGQECELRVSAPDGSGDRGVAAPFAGRWVDVGGPAVPGDSMPLATVSPDGRELLVGRVHERADGEDLPWVLLAVDLARGSSREIGRFDRPVPQATWSRDGRWVVVLDGDDVEIRDAADPARPARHLPGVVPPGHFVFAAG